MWIEQCLPNCCFHECFNGELQLTVNVVSEHLIDETRRFGHFAEAKLELKLDTRLPTRRAHRTRDRRRLLSGDGTA